MSRCSSQKLKLKWISCGQISMEQDQRLTTGWKHKSSYSTCASRSWMERCPQVMWMPTTNITPFEMVKQPLLTHLLTNLRSHIKFRNITDFMSCTITIKLIIADIEIKVRFLFLSLLLSVPVSINLRLVFRRSLPKENSYRSNHLTNQKGINASSNLVICVSKHQICVK